MTISAFIAVLWIYATPCKVNAPEGLTCREYAVHVSAEKALEQKQ